MSSALENKDREEAQQRENLVEQLQFWAEAASTETALFHQAAAAQYGLGITDMKTLSVLIQEGPMTIGKIGDRLGLTSGSVTALIDRLEAQELVKRQAHPKDRRKVVIVVNEEMLSRGPNVYHSMGEAFVRLLETYTVEQLEFLVQFYQASTQVTKQEIVKLAGRNQVSDV